MVDFHIGEFGQTPDSPLGRINFDKMLSDKLARARSKMREYDLSAIICLTEPNVAYVTNMPPIFPGGVIGGNRYAILPIDGDPIGFDECNTAFVLKNQLSGVRIEYGIPASGGPHAASAKDAQDFLTRKFANQIHTVLKEYKLDKEKIGIDAYIPSISTALIETGLNIVQEGGKALIESRAIKTRLELECLRSLAIIIDGCFATLARTLRAGVSENEIWSKCVSYAIENGLSTNGGFIVSGPHTWPKDNSRQFSNRRIRPGEIVYADFFNFGFFGYKACCYRTFSVGPASKEVRETYQRVYNWLREAEKTLRPGATTREVVENWPDDDQLWSNRPPFIRTEQEKLSTYWMNMGHALGLSLYEPPFFWAQVAKQWPQRIEKDMGIALETLDATQDGKYGVRVEDMILVTEEGHEVISKWPAEEITEVPLYQT